jgi:hypothetical protein
MLIKMWAFALVLALAAIPVTSSLAAGSDPAGAGPRPEENNATAGTAAAGSNTPSGKSDADAVNAARKADSEKSNDPARK